MTTRTSTTHAGSRLIVWDRCLWDWHGGFSAILNPLVGSWTSDILRAYHRFERLLEAETPHRLYKDVLVTALLRAAEQVGVNASATAGLVHSRIRGPRCRSSTIPNRCSRISARDGLPACRPHQLRRGPLRADPSLFPSAVRRGGDGRTSVRLQAVIDALSFLRSVVRGRRQRLGSRGVQLVSRHRTSARIGHQASVARSRSDRSGREDGIGIRSVRRRGPRGGRGPVPATPTDIPRRSGRIQG